MDDCRRCGAPLTENGCEYCGSGQRKFQAPIFEYRMTQEMIDDIINWDVPEIPMQKLESAKSEDCGSWWVLVILIAWFIGFVAVLANIPKDEPSRVAERGGPVPWSEYKVTLDREVSESREAGKKWAEEHQGEVEFVSVGTSSFGISVTPSKWASCEDASVCPGTIIPARINNPSSRPSNHFYHRRTSH